MAAQLQNPPPPSLSKSAVQFASRAARQSNNVSNIASNTAVRAPAHAQQQSTSSQVSNPFRTPIHTPQASESSSSQVVFSPVSPIDPTDIDNRFRQQQSRAQTKPNNSFQPAKTKMSSEPRKSVDLRKLDGKPYPGIEDDADATKSRKVKVAQDMYAGEMPPGYEKKDYEGPLAKKEGTKGACHKCGGHKKTGSEASSAPLSPESSQPQSPIEAQGSDCHKCGGKKSTPPSSFPRAAMGNAQPRSAPQASTRAAPITNSEAGPSGRRHSCTKCGRRKRPDSASTTTSSSQQARSPTAGISIQQRIPAIQTNGIPVMNVEPPTAITERAPTLPFSPASVHGDTPLIKHQNASSAPPSSYKPGHKPSRSGSISSLFRSLSRRRKSNDQSNPLPSQQLSSNSDSIVNKISHAMGDHPANGNHSNYSRLRPGDYPERPGSPFSFVDKPQEEQAFEMNDMRKSKHLDGTELDQVPTSERRNSWDKADESTKFLSDVSTAEQADRPRYSRSQSTREHLRPGTSQTLAAVTGQQDDLFLSLPPDQRPGVTRFKSLRSGVNRAANGLSRSASQISRSTSLRRLESVKKVPQFWYRDDMAIEGASGEYNQFAY